jgi:ankyrin repeat protein
VARGHKEIVELLLMHGADIQARDLAGAGPLHWAAKEGYTEIIEVLIAHGAELNAKDKQGRTPLQYAVSEGKQEAAGLIQKRGGHE